MPNLKDLREKRGKLIQDGRAVIDLADNEKRELTTDENTKYDAIFADIDKIGATIEREEKQAEIERSAVQSRAQEIEETGEKSGKAETQADLELRGANQWLKHGQFSADGGDEFRALQADADTLGGFLVMPQQMVSKLIQSIDDHVYMRGLATKFQTNGAQSLGAPSLDTDVDDANWTTELSTGSEDSSMAFGKRELNPHPLAKRIKISNKLLRNGTMSAEAIVRSRLAYKFALTQEKAFLTGSGDNQPLGIFTASDDGIGTGRDVSTDNTTTAITADGLINAKYSLKQQYQAKAEWMFHRDAVKMIAKLKDGNDQYLWQPGLQAGQPDRLLNRNLNMSEWVPSTFTTGLYVGMFGDFSNYWIADDLQMQIQRLVELYAESNQVGFIGRQSTDGMPVLSEAFARVTLA
tara:strand:+ start:144 stop:1367 length:1224 start_codon:yes stop_codon:yes gene_type:complete